VSTQINDDFEPKDPPGSISGGHLDELLPAYLNGSLDHLTTRRVQAHLARCAACRRALAAWTAIGEATLASAAAAAAELPSDGLLGRVFEQINQEQRREQPAGLAATIAPGPSSWTERMTTMIQPTQLLRRPWLARSITVAAATVALAAVVAFTPVGSYAQGFLTVFTPQKIAAVPITSAELKSLPDLNNYGTIVQPTGNQTKEVATAADAAAAAGMPVLVPATIPAGVPSTASYEVIPNQTGSFTFSAAKARAAAAAQGKTLPAMPANVDGSTLQVTVGAGVVAIYHANVTGPSATGEKTASGATKQETQQVPALIVGQAIAPSVTSTGASVAEIEQYLLAQPGISPDLAAAIRSIGDPTTTLPIPVPINRAISHPVNVQGVSGLSVADSTGLGGGIIWVKNGMVYGVAGALSESDLLDVANSLH
jgi:Putative zinc-finger